MLAWVGGLGLAFELRSACPSTPSALAATAALDEARSKRSTRWLPESATQRVPERSIARPIGELSSFGVSAAPFDAKSG